MRGWRWKGGVGSATLGRWLLSTPSDQGEATTSPSFLRKKLYVTTGFSTSAQGSPQTFLALNCTQNPWKIVGPAATRLSSNVAFHAPGHVGIGALVVARSAQRFPLGLEEVMQRPLDRPADRLSGVLLNLAVAHFHDRLRRALAFALLLNGGPPSLAFGWCQLHWTKVRPPPRRPFCTRDRASSGSLSCQSADSALSSRTAS